MTGTPIVAGGRGSRGLFSVPKPIIGMVHVRPLPGSPRFDGEPMDAIINRAVLDASTCAHEGLDGLIIENHGDVPFLHPDDIGPETVAGMTAVALAVKQSVAIPVGINILANGVILSLAVARATGAEFVRANQWVNAYVANEGFVAGKAGEALRFRSHLRGDDIRVFVDVHVKHGSHAIVADRSLEEQTHDAEFFDADVMIATGQRTSDPADVGEVTSIKSIATLPVFLGSGLTPDNAGELLRVADGAIVGSGIKEEGVWWNPVSPERIQKLMTVVTAIREETGGAVS